MKKILITQRYEKLGKFKEKRDNLDVRLANIISLLGYTPIILPNNLKNLNGFISQIKPHGIILSGGGDPLKKDIRFLNEKFLINYSIKKNLPLLGVCRGAQRIFGYFNGKLRKVKKHVRKNYQIYGDLVKKRKIVVNSYHNLGFYIHDLPKELKASSYSIDKIVKSFLHSKFKIIGIMWHPERYKKLKKFDRDLIKGIFK